MSSSPSPRATSLTMQQALVKVPVVTAFFWIIKVLATTVGETFADFINTSLGLGLTMTSLIMGALLAVALVFQFRASRYVAGIYWLAVVLISVAGTLITDNLTDNLGISLLVSTGIFFVLLVVTFAAWYRVEGTLAIHSIHTPRREAFYWLAILFTFALGTATGDLVAERFNLGYAVSLALFAGLIVVIAGAWKIKLLGEVWAFWLVYILTRPLGASLGDLMSQPKANGGFGLGTTVTSLIFLGAILVLVIYLTISKRDLTTVADAEAIEADEAAHSRRWDCVCGKQLPNAECCAPEAREDAEVIA